MYLYLGTEDGLAVFRGQRQEWQPRFLRLRGQRVTAVAAAGRQLWAGTREALWHSATSGESWERVASGPSPCHVRAIAVLPAVRTVLVGTEPAGVWLGHDGGRAWTESPDVARLRDEGRWSLPYSPAAGCVRSFAALGERVYAAAEVGGVLRSDDGGASWRLSSNGVHPDVHDVAVHPEDPDLVYAATGDGRYRSRDGGRRWERIGDGYTRAVWLDPERPDTLLAGPARYVGAMGRLERSNDGGQSWALASDGFRVPLADMIERLVTLGDYVLALSSEGTLYVAKRGLWMWRRLELGLPPVRAVAVGDEA